MFVPPMGSQMHFCFQKLSLEKKTDPNPLMLNCLHLSTCVCVCVCHPCAGAMLIFSVYRSSLNG